MTSIWRTLIDQTAIYRWIGQHRNLLLLRRRIKRQLPRGYRRGFYRTWLMSHLVASRRQRGMASDGLVPLTIKISPSMRCNLRCTGCFAGNYPPEHDMSPGTMTSVVRQAASLGIPSVGIIGGEPLLVPGIFDLFRAHRNVGFYMATNGTLVNEKVLGELQGLPHVMTVFSVDGFEETNDSFRGAGVFRKLVASMGMMKASGLAFGFSTVVHRGNRQEVVSEQYLDFFIDQGCLFGAFLPYIPVGSAPRNDLVCDETEVKEYYERLDAISARRAILVLKEGYSDGTFLNGGCGAGNTIHVTEKGEAEPCNGIQFCTSDVHASNLREIFLSPYFRDIRKLHPATRRECLVVAQPEKVMEIVRRHGAKETHRDALRHMETFAKTKGLS